MPLTEEEWERLKADVDRFFRDVARDIDAVAVEAQAVLRVSQRGDVPRDMGLVLEVSADSIGQSLARLGRRLRLFQRDLEDLRGAGDW